MSIEEGLIPTPAGVQLFYRFQAGDPKKNPLFLIHGHGEHSGRYLKFFTRLQDLGYSIAAFDLRGCGRSSGRRVFVDHFEDYTGDVDTVFNFLTKQQKVNPPVILFGHSLGGLIALTWARANGGKISKLILSSPLIGVPLEETKFRLGLFLDRLAPRLVLQNPVRPNYLTHDPEEIQKYQRDPLIQRKITARLACEMIRQARLIRQEAYSASFPVYLLMAKEDRIVDPEATRRFFSRLQAPARELEEFKGFYHEIFNELGQARTFERLRHYLIR
ncbi:MAG: lysophospholipase [Candidatus Omnitrophica bacterium]|nr:lysophospholipase [Candidatus Omnitrophota bacterium]